MASRLDSNAAGWVTRQPDRLGSVSGHAYFVWQTLATEVVEGDVMQVVIVAAERDNCADAARRQRNPKLSAVFRSSARSSGWAMSTKAWARSRTVSPISSATPYSVMTTPVWCRGVDTTEPSGSLPTMRETGVPAT